MNVFLLAAGKGTRLLPLTINVPKCLVEINGKPLLSYWIDLFAKYQINKIFINTHYLQEKVSYYLENFKGNINIETCYEKELLGSLGTLIINKSKIMVEQNVLVCYADNLTNINLNKFINFHNSHNLPISIGLFETDFPKDCGIIELDENNIVVSFEEKPECPKSNLANAGIYIFETSIFEPISFNNKLLDIAFDLLPNYIGKMKGYKLNDFIYDIGDIRKLEYAENYLKNNLNLF